MNQDFRFRILTPSILHPRASVEAVLFILRSPAALAAHARATSASSGYEKPGSAIERCRTATLGGHLDRCSQCGHRAISYNSCRNRHCPKCQTNARNKWLAKRSADLLPVRYFHVVFTLPHELAALALQNKRVVYDLLSRASAETLIEVAADPRHLGAQIGFMSVLHTWGQNLLHHPHVHCVIPAGGLAFDRSAWIPSTSKFFLPVKVLSRVFRGKFDAGLKRAFRRGKLSFHGNLTHLSEAKNFRSFRRQLFRHDWVVYAKRPFGGPEHVLHYLARYTHRVAISNHRLVSFEDGRVTFRWKDYAHGGKKREMTISADEFLRRFLLHFLPRGFVRIRHFGFLTNRHRSESVALCRRLIGEAPKTQPQPSQPAAALAGTWPCPRCAGPMIIIQRLSAEQIRRRCAEGEVFIDTS